jgi:hypothetical protein
MPAPTPAARAVLSGPPSNALLDERGRPVLDEAGRFILVS